MLHDETLAELNAATAAIPLTGARLPAVALEFAQLSQAAESGRARLDFDLEPSAFPRVLASLAT